MKKVLDTLRSASEKGSKVVNEAINEGVNYMKGKIGSLPYLASSEEVDNLGSAQYDEKHYFLIPYRISDLGYTFYSMRVLPDGVPPVNKLPKRRIFHFANEHGEHLAQSLLIKEIKGYYEEVDQPNSDTIGNRLIDIANEIDIVDNKLTNGLLVIGGLVSVLNPLVGVGIALLPGISSSLSKFGLKTVGDKLNENALKEEIQKAEKNIIEEFKDSNTLCVINPILHELELALDTTELEHDPSSQFDFSNSGFATDGVRLTKLTCTAITNTYDEIVTNNKQHKAASLGPEDLRWLQMISEVASESENELSIEFRSLRRRIAILKIRLQKDQNTNILEDLEKIENHLVYLLDNAKPRENIFSGDEFALKQITSAHLPEAIDNYLKLPSDFAKKQILKNGSTAEDTFREQLALLEQTLAKLVDSVCREDAREVILHGKFLKEIFGRSFLDPD